VKPIPAHPTVQRTLAHRLTALLALVFFLFSWTGEALGQHGCPHHDSVPGKAAVAQSPAHAHHGGAHAGHHAPAPEHADTHACTCQGSCPSVGAGAIPAADDAVLRVAPASVRQAAAPRVETIVPRLAPFFLPYSQGPPLVG
jgi:hypothetical protein